MSGTPERTRYCSRCLTTFAADAPRCPNLGCRAQRPASGWGELLEAGEVLDRTYRLHARLAIGGAGVTYLGGELGPDGGEVGPRVAIKVLYQQRDQGPYLRRLSTEAQILQGLNHPQIVECRGFVHRAGHSPYLVTRYEEGGSLLDHLRRVGTLPIPVVAGIGRQVCWALEVAHRQGVVHRDLKPENVLLVRQVDLEVVPEIRVADFGIAKVFGAVGDRLTRVGAFVGTPQYAAPEQFDGLSPEPATDVYAVGALLYFCLTARPVADFMAELEPESQKEHLVRHLPPKLPVDLGTPDLRRWMEETLAVAMAVDPGDRCDIGQLEARLASIQAERDPGFVRRPPAGHAVASPATLDGAVLTAQTLDTSHVRPLATEDLAGASGAHHIPPLPGAGESGAWRSPEVRNAADPSLVTARATPASGRTTARTSTRSLAGTRTLEALPEASTVGRLGCGVLVGAGAGAALLVAALLAWVLLPARPVVLTGAEGDAAVVEDWKAVAGTLGERGVAAELACKAPPYLAVEVVVEADGRVREVQLLNYPHEPTRACVEGELQKAAFPRKGDGPVQVAVTLQK